MRLKEITYRRIKNLGNYENETLEATVEVQKDEKPQEAFEALRDWVEERLFPSEAIAEISKKAEEDLPWE